MADPVIAEIVMFGGSFAPRGWALCDGQLLSISSNSALFSILGTTYGGDGRTTFGLPDLRGRVAMHPGNGPGLNPRLLGQKGGAQTSTLTAANLPPHTHNMQGNSGGGDEADPDGGYPSNSSPADNYNGATNVQMGVTSNNAGGTSQAFTNETPYQCVNFIIAIVGTFPSRN